jgi:hypothetical protein
VAVQEAFLALFAVLASVGRLFGYRARYPQYSGSSEPLEREDRHPAVVSEAMKGGVVAACALVTCVVLLLIWRRSCSSGR